MYKEIDSYQLKKILNQENVNLIDIRDNYLYSFGTIGNAKNIPVNFLITNPSNYLDKNEVYYIFCNYGSTSTRLCEILSKSGYSVVNIIDGYQGYKDSI